MTRSNVRGTINNEHDFYGRDLLFRVRTNNLDTQANDGTDLYVEKRSKNIFVTLGSIFAVGIIAVAISGMVGLALHSLTPLKLSAQDQAALHDSAMLMDDDATVNAQLSEFQDVTGICPVVYTVYEEDWQNTCGNLRLYAEYLYNQNYHDAQHLVIVFSISKNDAALVAQGQIPHYGMEVYQGEKTGAIVNTFVLWRIKSLIRENIRKGAGFDGAVVSAFEYAAADCDARMNPTVSRRAVNFGIALLPMIITMVIFAVWIIKVIVTYAKDRRVERIALGK